MCVSLVLAGVAVGTVVGVVVGPVAAGASTGWSTTSVGAPQIRDGALDGLSCMSATSCMAVGTYPSADGSPRPFAEVFKGSAWTQTAALPSPTGSRSASLVAVSCTAASNCLAVGTYRTATDAVLPLSLRWDGSAWKLRTVPVPSGATSASLNGVSCRSASACTAVGGYQPGHGFAVGFNGTSWSIVTTPAAPAVLSGVSCVSASFCAAVGLNRALRWNGSQWSAFTLPSGSSASTLRSVSCVSAASCQAVGSTQAPLGGTTVTRTFAMTWNGSAWKVATTPNPATGAGDVDRLAAVSCSSATSCLSVGSASHPGAVSTVSLAASWNGTSWATTKPRDVAGAVTNGLAAVSCVSGSCSAAGVSTVFASVGYDVIARPLIERRSGTTWTTATVAGALGAAESNLAAISCTTTSRCEAVGAYNSAAGAGQPLARGWDGTSWTDQAVPVPTGTFRYLALTAVACSGPNACAAVGTTTDATGVAGAFSDVWDGTSWRSAPFAQPAGASSIEIDGITCSAGACLAVGSYSAPSGGGVLAEHWDGTAWSLLPTPPSPAGAVSANLLAGSCVATICWAVGGYTDGATLEHPLAVRLVGSTWTTATVPDLPGGGSSSLQTVSCVASNQCTAIGSSAAGTYATVLAGTTWSQQQLPPVTGVDGYAVSSVSCASAAQCTAVGSIRTGVGTQTERLAYERNGTTWARVGLPGLPNADSDSLTSVSCVSATVCASVGSFDVHDTPDLTLAFALLPGPTPPVALTANQSAANSETITWTPPAMPGSQPITRYRVSRDDTDLDGHGAYTTVLSASARSFTFTRLATGTTYDLTVQAVTAAGDGAPATVTVQLT